ncbi:hypothetical protein [Paenibacillus tuaregi]|uniref:hypothetical protein n=1 Tax=Paenibacillus tuaregi TaxID=1816681 RepID=UPI000837AD8E|nr:hypothetical protein [Paenibacillus tuaregi]
MKTQYNEVKRKAAVGERIKIVKTFMPCGEYEVGDILTVSTARFPGNWTNVVFAEGVGVGIRHSEYVVLESDPLYDNFRQFVRDNADGLRKLLAEIDKVELRVSAVPVSKPLTRAEVIEKARKDVAELIRIGGDIWTDLPKGTPFHNRTYYAEFHVNREKRAVTALIYHGRNKRNMPDAKGIAKCAPGDVFHAEIGKAIALRKALGLPIPTEYTDAPQPDEPRVGAVVRRTTGRCIGENRVLKRRVPENDGGEYGNHAFVTDFGGWLADKQYEVIDDTDVDYGAVSAKETA